MANTLKINTRLLEVNWTTSTSYTINLGGGLVKEATGNRSPSAAQLNAKTFTTFSSGPTIASVTPTLGTTDSYVTTATVTYNRPIFASTNTYNIYLYKENVGGDELVSTIASNNARITTSARTLTIDLRNLVDGSSTYYLESDNSTIEDMFRFAAEKVTASKFKYSTAAGPQVVSKSPTSTATDVFVTTATITFNREIFTDTSTTTNSIVVYRSNNDLFDSLYTTSSAISIANTALNISLLTKPMPEGEYYITMNKAFVRDQYTFPAVAQTASDFLKVLQTSASNIVDRNYMADIANKAFLTSTPTIVDIDLNAEKQYTLKLSSPAGTFSASAGTQVGNTWTYTATKSEIDSLFDDIEFTRSLPNRNNDTTYTYALSKDGVTLVEKTRALNGVPMAFAGTMTVVPPSQTIYQLGPLVNVTATISSGTSFTGQVSVISTTSNRRNVIFTGTTFNDQQTIEPNIRHFRNVTHLGDLGTTTASNLTWIVGFYDVSWNWSYGDGSTSTYQGFTVGQPIQFYSNHYGKYENYIITDITNDYKNDSFTADYQFQLMLSYDFGQTMDQPVTGEPTYDTWLSRALYYWEVEQSGSEIQFTNDSLIKQGVYLDNSYQGDFFNPTVLTTQSVTGTNFINYSFNPEQSSTTQTNYLQAVWHGGLENSTMNKYIGTDSNVVSYSVSTATFTLVRDSNRSGGVAFRTYNTQTFVSTANTVTNGLKTLQMYLLANNEIAGSATTVGNSSTFVVQPGYFTTGTEYTFKTVYSGDVIVYSNSFNLTASS